MRSRKLFLCAGSVLGFSGAALALSSVTSLAAKCKDTPVWNYNWDFRDAPSLVKPGSPDDVIEGKRSVAQRKLYLIRHGQYEQKSDADKDRVLTTLGRTQAECTGQHLAKLGVKYSDFTVSTMTRANETGEIILNQLQKTESDVIEEGIEVEKTDILREGHPINAVPYSRFKPDNWEFSDGCRIESAFRRYFYRAHYNQKEQSHEIIVCHANVIRYFVCRALQNPPEGWLRMGLANGSVTEVIIEPNGEVFITGIGDKGHMPTDMVTFS